MADPRLPRSSPPARLRPTARSLRSLVILLTVLLAFRSTVADWNDVPTQSMEPTILGGDRIAVNRLAYGLRVPFTTWHLARWDAPARGEVVVFHEPTSGRRMVKRVVGIPGDRVELRGDRLLINGSAVPVEPLAASPVPTEQLADPPPYRFEREWIAGHEHALLHQPARHARRTFASVTLPPDRYFVMGDNRDNSHDSRFFGFVPRDQIVGRVVGVALSVGPSFRPRWDRFGRGVR